MVLHTNVEVFKYVPLLQDWHSFKEGPEQDLQEISQAIHTGGIS